MSTSPTQPTLQSLINMVAGNPRTTAVGIGVGVAYVIVKLLSPHFGWGVDPHFSLTEIIGLLGAAGLGVVSKDGHNVSSGSH